MRLENVISSILRHGGIQRTIVVIETYHRGSRCWALSGIRCARIIFSHLAMTHIEISLVFRYSDIQRIRGYVAEIRRNESGHVQRVLIKSFAGVAVLPLQTREVSISISSPVNLPIHDPSEPSPPNLMRRTSLSPNSPSSLSARKSLQMRPSRSLRRTWMV